MTLAHATPGPRERKFPTAIAFIAIAVIVGFLYAGRSGWIFAVRLLLDGLVALMWAGGCSGIGRLCWDGLLGKIRLPMSLRFAGSFALGAGIVSLATLLLGMVGALNQATTWGMMAVGLVVILLKLMGWIRQKTPFHLDPWLLPLAGIAGIVLVASFVPPGALWANAEPNGYDVVEYHFQIPREWYESGVIEPLRHNVFSYFPFGVEMHYLLAMHLNQGPFAGMYVAQLMHAVFVVMSVVATHGIAVALGRSGTLAALAAGVCPWLLLLAPIGFNEGGLLLYGALAIGLLLLAIRTNSLRLVTAAGVFAGFACGVKLTAVPMVVLIPIFATLLFKVTIARREVSLGALAMYGVIAVGIFSPWLIRNMVWIGNPVFPEATGVLGKAYLSDEQVDRWNRATSPPPAQQSVVARVRAARDQILRDWRFGYLPIPLAIASLLMFRRRDDIVLFIILAMMLIFWLAFTHLQGRFFVLMIPLVAVVVAGLPWKHIVASCLFVAGVAGWIRWQLTYYRDDNPTKGTLARSAENGVLGLESLDVLKIVDLSHAPKDRVVVLVGDATPFWFSSIPMSRLRYRTVFDVDTRGRGALETWCDWTEPLPSDAIIVIDPIELDRFSKTYGTPAPDAALYRDGMPYVLER